ncbi:MAG: isocitrate dehydrogenase, partial [Pseudonocardia sp.]|nr:isocitrate dehydrogenase [Pseudonocardia sp.]
LALAVSLEFLADKDDNPGAAVLGKALDDATGTLLENGQSPSRRVGELDNRGSHFYLALYWAQALAAQTENADLAKVFAPLAERLAADEDKIIGELSGVQGQPVELGGYYYVDKAKTDEIMRPCPTLNAAISEF